MLTISVRTPFFYYHQYEQPVQGKWFFLIDLHISLFISYTKFCSSRVVIRWPAVAKSDRSISPLTLHHFPIIHTPCLTGIKTTNRNSQMNIIEREYDAGVFFNQKTAYLRFRKDRTLRKIKTRLNSFIALFVRHASFLSFLARKCTELDKQHEYRNDRYANYDHLSVNNDNDHHRHNIHQHDVSNNHIHHHLSNDYNYHY